jgi:hypothetical protein
MSIRAHRVVKIVHADNSLFKLGESPLSKFLLNHGDTNDQRNSDGGGMVEFPFRVLKEAKNNAEDIGLDQYDIDTLTDEICILENEGKDDEEYLQYDLF